jgi:hypothetical protein
MQANRGFAGGKFCRNGINCRGRRTIGGVKTPGFIGVLAMARRLLIDRRGSERPRHAASVGVLSMLFALGAVSSVLDAAQSLTSSGSSTASSSAASAGFGESAAELLDAAGVPASASAPASGSAGFSQLSPATMSALLAAQSQSSNATTVPTSTSPTAALQDLFSQIDANGDGQISKTEFENALGAGGTNLAQADDVFSKLDTSGDGSVSLGELSSALKGAAGKGSGHHHHVAGSNGSGKSSGTNGSSSATAGSSADPLTQALQAASSTSTANSNGSTTTALTYADGSTVTMTSPPATTSSSSATSSYNLMEQMIQREAQAISFATASQSLSLSA